jgi:hypothetical protein
MSVEDKNVVDAIGTERDSGNIILTISDQLEWEGQEHLLILQNKINTYFRFIESGEIFESYPQAKGQKLVISVVCLHEPDEEAIVFLDRAKEVAKSARIGFRYKQSHFNSPPK